MNANDLREAVVAALAPVADQLADDDRLDVRGNRHVAACPASIALEGESPFEPNPRLAAWELSVRAADRLLHGPLDPGSGRAATTPHEALAMAADEVTDNWAFDWWAEAGDAGQALARSAVAGRIAGTARLATTWPPAGPVTAGHTPSWPFPGRPLRLRGRVDLVLGRRGHDHTLVVSLGGDHAATTRPRLAFEALVETLTLRRPPANVVGLLPDAGRRWRVAVDDALLAEGVAAAATAARTALGARRHDAAGLPRRPSGACRYCAHASACGDGQAWLAGPGRLRLGFLPTN